MNLKRQAKKLEHLFEQEVRKELPIALLNDGSMMFENFKIKKTKQGTWDIFHYRGPKIDSFNLKACALMAAKLYKNNRLSTYNEVKILDQTYQKNYNDSEIFKYRFVNTQDMDKRDVFLWRFEIAINRAKEAKLQISNKFRNMF